jgi:FtsH-binding integral membrane protein
MPDKTLSHLVPQRNEDTHAQHRKQMFWQVFFPLGVGVILMLGVCVLPVAAVAQNGDVSKWADISLIWLILPALILSVIPLALLVGMIYGVTRLVGVLPGWMFKLQGLLETVKMYVRRYADKVVEPVIWYESFRASVGAAMPKQNRKD